MDSIRLFFKQLFRSTATKMLSGEDADSSGKQEICAMDI